MWGLEVARTPEFVPGSQGMLGYGIREMGSIFGFEPQQWCHCQLIQQQSIGEFPQ